MRRKLFVCAVALMSGVVISEYNTLLALVVILAAFAVYRIKGKGKSGSSREVSDSRMKKKADDREKTVAAGRGETVFYRVPISFFALGIVLMSVSQCRSIYLDSCFKDKESRFTAQVLAVECKSSKEIDNSKGTYGGYRSKRHGVSGGMRYPKGAYGQEQKQVKYTVRLIEKNGEELPFFKRPKVLVTSYKGSEAGLSGVPYEMPGKFIRCTLTPEKAAGSGNPRCFDYGLYLKSKGIDYIARQETFESSPERGCPAVNVFYALMRKMLLMREGFLRHLNLGEDEKSVLRGVLFGDTGEMSEETYEAFQNNGTAHVLAVSGLHVGILYGLYRRLTARRKSKALTALMALFLFMYGCLTLWSISATRAILFIYIIIVGDILERPVDMLTSLAVVAIAVIVKNPWIVYGAGFQMSFIAIISICFLSPAISKAIPGGMGGAVSVQLGMLPFLAYTFNKIPIISVLCNIPVVFALSLAVPLGMAGFVSYAIIGSGLVLGALSARVAAMMTWINKLPEFIGAFTVQVCSPSFGAVVFFYLLLFFLSSETFTVLKNRKSHNITVLVLSAIVIISVLSQITAAIPFDKATGVMVDVGQGDCFHLKVDRNINLLFDGGGNENYNVGKKILKPYFLHNGTDKINAAFATHLHTDHYKGIEELSKCFEVRKIVIKGKAGDEYRLSKNAKVKIIWPEKQDFTVDDENKNSLVFKIYAGGMSVLITGDMTAEGERAIVEKYRGSGVLRADVLKVAHHGSKYSSTEEFLDAVKPKLALIGVGKNNYGHPSDEVIEKLKERGIITYRTDMDGAIGIWREKGRIEVCRQKTEENPGTGTLPWILKKVCSKTRY